MSRIRTFIAITAVLAMTAIAVPAHATITGGLEFQCTAELPIFPNSDPTVEGTCGDDTDGRDGTVNGSASGLADDDEEYVVTIVNGDIDATFTYDEQCTAGEPLQGTANGDVTVTGGEATKGGVSLDATLTADFSWERTGLTADIVLTNIVIKFSDGETATAELPGRAQAGFNPDPLPDCNNPQPISADVAGTAEVAA